MKRSPKPFERFRLFYPPRAKGAINPDSLGRFTGFIAQPKYDDVRTLVYVFPDGHVELYNRQKEPLGRSSPSPRAVESVRKLGLRRGVFHVFDGGSMMKKLILWDILVHEGCYLLGTTYAERYERLRAICGHPTRLEQDTRHGLALEVGPDLWLAPCFDQMLPDTFRRFAAHEEIEGLVLKNPAGRLEPGLRRENNGSWQIRVRKPDTHYPF